MTTSRSTSQTISEWKKRAEIDYFPLFMSLWLALNAWMTDRFQESNDRDSLELLKTSTTGQLFQRFSSLLQATDANGSRFKSNLALLHRSLENARIPYDRFPNNTISFGDCITDWNNRDAQSNLIFGSVLKEQQQRNKLKIDENLWFEDDIELLFSVYIEIVYQIRCSLFHGNLVPNDNNDRVIQQIYLTLSMVMEQI